ncbi:MAG: hypothetical protein WKF76_00680 [Nocardioidaceae bacterium]
MALLASGFAASSVGTYAGQVVMQGFSARRIPLRGPAAGHAWHRLLIVLAIGRRTHPGAGAVPGGAVLRHPVRPGAARTAHPATAT